MVHQTERVNKTVVSGISVVVLVFSIFLFDHYYSNANVLPQLSKWVRIGIMLSVAVILSCLINAILIKICPTLLLKKSSPKQ